MKLVHAVAVLVSLSSLALVAPGCGDSPLDKDPKAVLAQTTAALQSPTGTLSAQAMPRVFSKARAQGSANVAVGLTGLSGSSSVTSSPSSHPMGGGGLACIDGDTTEGSFDLGCLDPAFSGTIEYRVEIDAGSIYEMVALESVCAEGVCIDGYMALGVTSQPSEVEAYASVDLSGPITEHLEFGFDAKTGGETSSFAMVAFDDDGASFVFDASVDADDGMVTVRGANGTWSCEYDADGGTCTNTDDGDTFSWG